MLLLSQVRALTCLRRPPPPCMLRCCCPACFKYASSPVLCTCLQISKLEEVYALKKYTPQLTYLDMSDNPLSDDKSYRCGGSVWT